MIDVRFWRMYSAFYSEDSFIRTSLMETQEECFKHENNGIKLKHDMCVVVTGDLTQLFSQPKTLEKYNRKIYVANEVCP